MSRHWHNPEPQPRPKVKSFVVADEEYPTRRAHHAGPGFRHVVITLIAFLIAALTSSVIAIVTRRLDLGLATMATIAAWVTCIEGALLLYHL